MGTCPKCRHVDETKCSWCEGAERDCKMCDGYGNVLCVPCWAKENRMTCDTKALMKNVLKTKGQTGAGDNIYQWPQQKTEFRLLPFVKNGQPDLFVTVAQHWFGDGDNRYAVKCTGKDCPICKAVNALPKDNQSQYKGKLTMYANGVIKTADGPVLKVLRFSAGTVGSKRNKSFGAKLVALIDSQGPDLVMNHNFIVMRTGEGLQTTYEIQPSVSKSTIDVSEFESQVSTLDEFIPADPSAEDVEAALKEIMPF